MVKVSIDLSEREYREYLKRKGDHTNREILLKGADLIASPRIIGRPRMVSHDVCSDSELTDHHRIEGFDDDVFRKAQDARLKKKRGG